MHHQAPEVMAAPESNGRTVFITPQVEQAWDLPPLALGASAAAAVAASPLAELTDSQTLVAAAALVLEPHQPMALPVVEATAAPAS